MTFDRQGGIEARDEAIERVDSHAPGEWKAAADAAIEYCARTFTDFTTDQVWRTLDQWGVERPPETRAMGARVTAATKAGIIRPIERRRNSEIKSSHRLPKRVYRPGPAIVPTQVVVAHCPTCICQGRSR